jgi:hypothetical protein
MVMGKVDSHRKKTESRPISLTLLSNDFLSRSPIAQEIISIEKWYCIKLKGFCMAKETNTIVNRLPKE